MSDHSSNSIEFIVKLSSKNFYGEYSVKSLTLHGEEGDFTILPNHTDYVSPLKNSSFTLVINKETLVLSNNEAKIDNLKTISAETKILKFYILGGLAVFKDNILLILSNELIELNNLTNDNFQTKIKYIQTQLDICTDEEKKLYFIQQLSNYQLILNDLVKNKF